MARARAARLEARHEIAVSWLPYELHPEIPDGGVLVYPELDDIIDKICYLAPEALVDLVDDVLIIRHLQSSTII